MPTISESDLKRLRGSVDELSALNEIAIAMASTRSVQEITKLILNHCLRRVGASQGALFLLADSVPTAVTFERAAIDAESGLPIHLNESLKGWITANKQILLMNSPDTDSRFAGMDFAIIGLFIFRRYYEGNKKTAYEAAVKHNRDIQIQYQIKLNEFYEFPVK